MSTSQSEKNDRILVADIGGTHARFGIATLQSGIQRPKVDHFQVFECADHHDIKALVQHYLDRLPVKQPNIATLAVAGAVTDNKGIITNLGWHLDGEQLAKALAFDHLYFINDFGALAMATPSLDASDILTIRSAENPVKGPISVIGPGTGFGVALLVPSGEDYIPVSSEGGHMSIAPKGELENTICKNLSKEMDRISVETLLSGIGLMRIYRALCSINSSSPRNYDPRTISQLGIENEDAICRQTLTVFCSLLGSAAGDIALVQGAKGGVYLGGGILPKMADFFQQSGFLEHFLDKNPMQSYLDNIPIHLIIAPDAALIGAAIYGRNMMKAAI